MEQGEEAKVSTTRMERDRSVRPPMRSVWRLRGSGQEETKAKLEAEFADVQCMMMLCEEYGLVKQQNIQRGIIGKRKKLATWSDLINEADASKRWFPLPAFENVELPQSAAINGTCCPVCSVLESATLPTTRSLTCQHCASKQCHPGCQEGDLSLRTRIQINVVGVPALHRKLHCATHLFSTTHHGCTSTVGGC